MSSKAQSKDASFTESLFVCGSSHLEVFCYKKVYLEISQNSQENTCANVYFLIKLQFRSTRKNPFHTFHPSLKIKLMDHVIFLNELTVIYKPIMNH